MTTIAITAIEPPPPNKKQARITDATGATWYIDPKNLVGYEIGRRYQVEFSESEFKGKTYRTISKGYPVDDGPPSGNGSRSHSSPDELHFVTTLLAAFIRSGQIKASTAGIDPDDKKALWNTVKDLRSCYAATFGAKANGQTH